MALPTQKYIYVPLLLELERAGGSAQESPSLYEAVARHFPDLTSEDKQILRQDCRTLAWRNDIDWARNKLRENGELNGGERGAWTSTSTGRIRLNRDLINLGIPRQDMADFVASDGTLQGKTGGRWRPTGKRFRPASKGKPSEVARTRGTQLVRETPDKDAVTGLSATITTPNIHDELKSSLLELEPNHFEKLIGELLQSMGMSEAEITGRVGDGGIDGTAEMPVMGVRIAFQANRWQPSNSVGANPVRGLIGSVAVNRFDRGVFITTSAFTAGAREEADKPDSKVILIDGDRLVDLMVNRGLGVKKCLWSRKN